MIPFKKINLGGALDAIKPLIDSGYIGLGNVVFDFERELAEYVGAKYVVACDSCTSALFLSLKWEKRHHNHRKQRKITIPSMTVPLVACAAIEAGNFITFNDQTKWVGKYYNLDGTKVVDSAHELRRGQYARMLKEEGYDDDLKLCFSFYPTKTIGSADGGAIATNNKEFADWARTIATYGRNQAQKYGNSWDYDVVAIGYKRHYTNLQSAICLEQLHRLDETNAKRAAITKKYNDAFGLSVDSDYLYRIDMEKRDEFIEYMKENGVECGVHFKPLHLMKPFRKFAVQNKEAIEAAYKTTVSLPHYDLMTDDEIQKVIDLTLAFKK